MALQFRSAYIATSSRVFGRGELVIDPAKIAERFIPLISELKKGAGAFVEGACGGGAYYLPWYMLASHITGAFWYMLSVERNDTCWRFACKVRPDPRLCVQILYCGSKFVSNRDTEWIKTVPELLKSNCSAKADDSKFNSGIYGQAISSGIVS